MTTNLANRLKAAVGLLAKGETTASYRALQTILGAAREAGDAGIEATALHLMGVAAHDQGRIDEARMLIENSLFLKQRIGDLRGETASYHQLGIIAQDQGRYAEAEANFQRSLAVAEQLDRKSVV